jgi:hypothetical protein
MIARAIDRQAYTMCRYFELDHNDEMKVGWGKGREGPRIRERGREGGREEARREEGEGGRGGGRGGRRKEGDHKCDRLTGLYHVPLFQIRLQHR